MTTFAPSPSASLSAWLLEQVAADEAAALAAQWVPFLAEPEPVSWTLGPSAEYGGDIKQIPEHYWPPDPARVLANVAALRAVIAEAEALANWQPGSTESSSGEFILRALAQPFAGRDGWQEAWGDA